MPGLPVTARALHRRRIRLRDYLLERASLFPFFDREGRVQSLMLVWPPAPEIVMLPYEPGLFRIRWWDEIELRASFASLRDLGAIETIGAVAAVWLWHYDPWWVLRAACYDNHPAVPALKATNCAGGFLKPVYGCVFSSDLSRLIRVTTRSGSASGLAAVDRTSIAFTPDLLPDDPSIGRPVKAVREWTLDPFWLRAGSRSPFVLRQ